MKLDVSKALRDPGTSYPLDVVQTIAPQENFGEEVTFEDASLKGSYQALEDGSVVVEGTLQTVAHSHCAKCLEPASADISTPFRETFLRDGDPEDDEIFAYSSSVIDFEKLAMSYAVLNMPIRFLCREGCAGFGDYSGEDDALNHNEDENEHPFAALRQLLREDEEV